jgi:Zn-dependent M16 (insulinase) family peptidase
MYAKIKICFLPESLSTCFKFAGVFSFLSYRDPNLVKTLDNYDGTVEFPQNLQLCDDALTKAIIGTIVDVDSYQLPVAKGYTRYVNRTDEFLY